MYHRRKSLCFFFSPRELHNYLRSLFWLTGKCLTQAPPHKLLEVSAHIIHLRSLFSRLLPTVNNQEERTIPLIFYLEKSWQICHLVPQQLYLLKLFENKFLSDRTAKLFLFTNIVKLNGHTSRLHHVCLWLQVPLGTMPCTPRSHVC